MPVLKKQKHELFAQAIAQNFTPAQAYVKAGFSEKGAEFSSSRLRKNVTVSRRIEELCAVSAQIFVKGNIADRNYRVAVLDEVAERIVTEIRISDSLRRETGLLRELREYHKQAAIEVGDWSEKQELTVKADEPKTDWSKVPLATIQLAREKMIEAQKLYEALPGSVEEVKE